MSAIPVRAATAADGSAVVRTLARAFEADPYISWVTGGRRGASERYFRLSFEELTLPHGAVFTTNDCSGVALWVPPHGWQHGPGEWLRLLPTLVRIVGVTRWPRISRGITDIERGRPPGPWYLLALIGTVPELQGRGIGSALMQPMLDRCDREGVSAVLDTTVRDNVSFYERRGFRVTGAVELPGGPTCWSMLREPG